MTLMMPQSKEEVNSVVYIPRWLSCVFVYVLPHQYSVRILDLCFAEGFRVLPRFALAILKALQADLLKLKYSPIVAKLLEPTGVLSVAPEELVKHATGFNIASKLDKLNKSMASK
jgi:hypothetical protein